MFQAKKFNRDRIYVSWWLIFEIRHVFGFVHLAGVCCVSIASKDRAASMFRVDM
jgi:hypothetical protein